MLDPKTTSVATPTVPPAYSLHTVCCLVAIYSLAVISGVREVYRNQPSTLDFIVSVAMAICLGTWAVVDAGHRRYKIPMSSQAWFVLFAGVVVPGYVIWSRGWRGLGWVILHSILWCALTVISYVLAGLMIYGN